MPINYKLPEKNDVQGPVRNEDKLIQNITFFGDSAIPEENPVYKSVWNAARLLAQNDFKIVNGGGPGIMKAATDGAESINGQTIAIYWQPKLASYFEGRNLANVTDESESVSNYMIRTLGLIEHGDAYVVCKGGTGTISEFGMVWALAKLYYGCHKPVILYGDFWDKIISNIQENMNIDEKELGVLYNVNSPEALLAIIQEHELKIQNCRSKRYSSDEGAFLIGEKVRTTLDTYNTQASAYHTKYAGNLVAQDQLDEFIKLINPPAKVMDIGTGPGFDAQYLSTKFTVTGVEIAEKFVDIARYENPGMEIINDDIVALDIGKKIYKGIWARDSIHHISEKDLDGVFQKISDALVDDGILYIIVRKGEGEQVEKEVKNYQKTERFYHFFTKEELTERTSKAGFEMMSIEITQRSHEWLVGIFRKKANQ